MRCKRRAHGQWNFGEVVGCSSMLQARLNAEVLSISLWHPHVQNDVPVCRGWALWSVINTYWPAPSSHGFCPVLLGGGGLFHRLVLIKSFILWHYLWSSEPSASHSLAWVAQLWIEQRIGYVQMWICECFKFCAFHAKIAVGWAFDTPDPLSSLLKSVADLDAAISFVL